MIFVEFIFWACFFAMIYPYLGYPLLLLIFSIVRNDVISRKDITPFVSIVISAYNEEVVIANKIENSLGLDYPKELLEIAIISDGSEDMTNDIISKYAKKDNRIRPYIVSVNKGKTSCLNDFIPLLKGEIVLFTDANSFFDKDVIRNIVRPFADTRLGFVTGTTKYVISSADRTVEAISFYSRVEMCIKSLESKIGSCVGADGAIFAIRKRLFSPMKPYDINDLVIPMNIIKQGFRGIVEKNVFCREQATDEILGEFNRQIRITARTLRAIFNYKSLLNPLNYPLFSFEVFSHKLMKLTAPFYMILMFLLNIYLFAKGFLFYQFVMIMQILFYLLAGMGFLKKTSGKKKGLLDLCHSYLVVNAAYFVGWFKYFSKETYIYWVPKR